MIQYKTPGICIFESALYRTTCTVIETPGLVLLVDPNWLPHEVARAREYVRVIRRGRPLWLLFTHSDFDHILGWKAFPDAKVIASRAFVHQVDQEQALEEIRKFDETHYLSRDYAVEYPEVDIEIHENGQALELEDMRLQFWPAPGHTACGLFTLVEHAGIWIAGDYLSNVEFPFITFSTMAYEQTLELARQLAGSHHPRLLIPGHGDATKDSREIQRRIDESAWYLHHLRKAVEDGVAFPEGELWRRYAYRRGLEGPHRENMAFLAKEIKG